MHEMAEPARYTPAPNDTLTDDVFANARAHGPEIGYSRRVGDHWLPVTHTQLADQVTDVAAGLVAWGLAPGDRVAIMAGTSFEWMVCDFAIWTAGGVTVPIYETSSAEQVEWILRDSGAVGVFVANADAAATIASVRSTLTDLRSVWILATHDLDFLATSGRDIDR